MSYLQLNNILTPNQFGFREKHWTYTANVKIVDQISKATDKNMLTLGYVYLLICRRPLIRLITKFSLKS